MSLKLHNLFADIPVELPDELFSPLYESDAVKIERIISHGHVTPVEHWYDQAWDEWVLVLQGKATISYKAAPATQLQIGDHLLIPAHTLHRVDWTDPDTNTVWLAVHIKPA